MTFLLSLVLVVSLTGCEEDVVAVVGTEFPYTLWGVLSPALDSQWVRVFPVEGRLELFPEEPLDAEVVSTDLVTGEQRVWNDSLVRGFRDHISHVYWAPFTAAYGHTYRLEVRRSDGAMTHVTTTVPPRTELVMREALVTASGVTLPVLVEGGAPRLLKVDVVYDVSFRPGTLDIVGDTVRFSYQRKLVQTPDGWVIPIDLSGDRRAIQDTLVQRTRLPLDVSVGIILVNMQLRLIVANEEWDPPFGAFDAAVLVQPGVMNNVENGFGFIGAGYRIRQVWTPPDAAMEAAGFRSRRPETQQ